MMRRLQLVIVSLVAVLSFGLIIASTPVFADDTAKKNIEEICAANSNASVCKDLRDPDERRVSDTFRNIINLCIFAAGIVAIISIIISGMRFVSSHGDTGAVNKARTSLIYSVIGLIVVTFAFAIVNFVIDRLNQ